MTAKERAEVAAELADRAEIVKAFGDKVSSDTVILCDGSNLYVVLEDMRTKTCWLRGNFSMNFLSRQRGF